MADDKKEGAEVIDYDSDDCDSYEDASESLDAAPDDLTRPKDWESRSKPENDNEVNDNNEGEEKKDSLGHDESSPDYVDEDLLISWEQGDSPLSESELEQKRLEAAQYKIEGNALYSDGKIREACGKIFISY